MPSRECIIAIDQSIGITRDEGTPNGVRTTTISGDETGVKTEGVKVGFKLGRVDGWEVGGFQLGRIDGWEVGGLETGFP